MAALIRLKAIGLSGILTAIDSRPEVTIEETMADFLRTNVKGPGQNASTKSKVIL